jgi:hypothetical protein
VTAVFVVTCRVLGHVREYVPGNRDVYEVTLERPETIAQIVGRLGSDPALFVSALIDGQARLKDFLVERACELVLVSPAAGG